MVPSSLFLGKIEFRRHPFGKFANFYDTTVDLNDINKDEGRQLIDLWSPLIAKRVECFEPPANMTPLHLCAESSYTLSCPPDWKDGAIRKACENGGTSFASGFLKINEIVTPTKINYINYFCAVCHGKISVKDELYCGLFKHGGDYPKRPDPVYSMEKLFDFSSEAGFASDVLCGEGKTYIEGEKRCRRIKRYQDFMKKNFVEVHFPLPILDPRTLPFDKASKIMSAMEDTPVAKNIMFYIGKCKRSWKDGIDFITIGSSTSGKGFEDILTNSQEITKFISDLVNISYKDISVKISGLTSECDLLPHTLENVTFDHQGVLSLSNNSRIQPGLYFVGNSSVFACTSGKVWLYSSTVAWVTIMAMIISILCLIIYFICRYCFKSNDPMLGLACSLFVAHTAFLVAPQFRGIYSMCYLGGIVLHWSFLASFACMNAIALDIWNLVALAAKLQLAENNSLMPRIRKFIMPFVIPTAVIVVTVVVDWLPVAHAWKAQYGKQLCWLNGGTALLVYFVVPVALYVLTTAVLTCMSGVRLSVMATNPVGPHRSRLMMFLKLGALTGCSWIAGFIAVPLKNETVFILFVILNASQGLYILLAAFGSKLYKKCKKGALSGRGRRKSVKDTKETNC